MDSPFPGMNPYLEQFWGDIHHRFITYCSDAIQTKGRFRASSGRETLTTSS